MSSLSGLPWARSAEHTCTSTISPSSTSNACAAVNNLRRFNGPLPLPGSCGNRLAIRRPIAAVIDSTLRFGNIRLPFVSYVLHLVEAGGHLSAASPEIAGFREIWPGDLPTIAAQLRAIPGERGYWGRWRAVAHDVVAEYFLMVNGLSSIVN